MAELPEHHVRYARAWNLYRDKSLPDNCKKILEKEMDDAQNHFGWDEFQEFKKTLPNFEKFWGDWHEDMKEYVKHIDKDA